MYVVLYICYACQYWLMFTHIHAAVHMCTDVVHTRSPLHEDTQPCTSGTASIISTNAIDMHYAELRRGLKRRRNVTTCRRPGASI